MEQKDNHTDTIDSFKNIEIISKIGQKITSTLHIDEVIESLYDSIKTMMDATGLVIYIFNPVLKGLKLKYHLGKQKNIADFIPIDSETSFCIYSLKKQNGTIY